jgi:6-pyruvoyl-tetrahydropterin synthase related domain
MANPEHLKNSQSMNTPQILQKRLRGWVIAAVPGCALAAWLSRAFFVLPLDQIHRNHEGLSYVYRLIDFFDLLASGYWFPQWASYSHHGLGIPYFSFYQPGFFYASSFFHLFLPPTRALGATLFAFALVGYVGMWRLVSTRFGNACGRLAATLFLLSVFPSTEIYIRGDLSEFSTMMLLPFFFHFLLCWLESPRLASALPLGVGAGLLFVMHPCVALPTLSLVGLVLVLHALRAKRFSTLLKGGVVLGWGMGLAAFHVLPILFEMKWVSQVQHPFYHYSRHYTSPVSLIGRYGSSPAVVPVTHGPVICSLLVVTLVYLYLARAGLNERQRGFATCCFLAWLGSCFMMTQFSLPVWQVLPMWHHLQFPWRLLALSTTLSAAFCGCLLFGLGKPTREILATIIVVALACLAPHYSPLSQTSTFVLPQQASELVSVSPPYIPDADYEWVPQGANRYQQEQPPTLPTTSSLDCTGERFVRKQGQLLLDVAVGNATGACRVTFPHYYYPAGWGATLNGSAVLIARDLNGLLAVDLPSGSQGRLSVQFQATPMRRLGLFVSAFFLLLGAVGLFLQRKSALPKLSFSSLERQLRSLWQGHGGNTCTAPENARYHDT